MREPKMLTADEADGCIGSFRSLLTWPTAEINEDENSLDLSVYTPEEYLRVTHYRNKDLDGPARLSILLRDKNVISTKEFLEVWSLGNLRMDDGVAFGIIRNQLQYGLTLDIVDH